MEFDNEKLKDTLEHARVNYWTVTIICSVFLSLLINKITLLEVDIVAVIYFVFFLSTGFGALKLSNWVESIKKEIIRNNSYQRN